MPQTRELPDLDRLPPALRLALAYSPSRTRAHLAALMLLDMQFANFVRTANEPVLVQMRLAWWRDRFAQDPAEWPKGNPVLASFADLGTQAALLGGVVDGWERLIGERPLAPEAVSAHAEERAQGWQALAGPWAKSLVSPAISNAAKRWALVDFAWSLADQGEHEVALDIARALPRSASLPRELRSLAVLDGLAQRSLAKGRPPLSRAADMTIALRIGLFGR